MEPKLKKFFVLSSVGGNYYYGESMTIVDRQLLIYDGFGELVAAHSEWQIAFCAGDKE